MALIELQKFRERLKRLIDEYFDGKASKFARLTGIENSAISRWLSGASEPTRRNLLLVREAGINDEWLLTGQGEMIIDREKFFNSYADIVRERLAQYLSSNITQTTHHDTYIRMSSIPANAGRAYMFNDISEYMLLVSKKYSDKKYVAFRVSGDSMQPTLPDECIVVVDTSKEPDDGDIVVCQYNNELLCKRIEIKTTGVLLRSDNKNYPDIKIDNLEFRIIGVVVHAEINFY
jgi:phage repressor protein C with HTH and peptisase S24 domain